MAEAREIPPGAVEAVARRHFKDDWFVGPTNYRGTRPFTEDEKEHWRKQARRKARADLEVALSHLASSPEGRAYLLRLVLSEEELEMVVDDGDALTDKIGPPQHESARKAWWLLRAALESFGEMGTNDP